jgi:hypothetical protein
MTEPQEFTTSSGNIQGIMDGVNPLFSVGVALRFIRVFRNGQSLTLGIDCYFGNRFVTFLGPQIPQPGDNLKFLGWPLG